MNWMEFLIELLDKLIWPSVVLVCLYLFKVPIKSLIKNTQSFKYKDLELDFGKELKAVTEKAEIAFPELKQDKKTILINSADKMPNSAVLEAWKTVDQSAEALIRSKRSDVDLNLNTRYKTMENILIKGKIVDPKTGKIFNELRQLRNKVAHATDYEVGKGEAIQYIELCFKLIGHLKALTN